MGMVIGIDVGGSTTKIIGIEEGKVRAPLFVRATDPVTSLFGAFGKYLYDNNIGLDAIEKVMLTGVGSAYLNQPLYNLPTAKADEFLCNGLGGRFLSGLERTIIGSMGTGTSLVRVEGDAIEHIGGVGIGGGTIAGLSSLLLKTQDFHRITELAMEGSVDSIDLQIRDITSHPLPGLPLDATASNFGKATSDASEPDIARGLINMVLQCVGKSAILSSLGSGIRGFVLIGSLSPLPFCPPVFRQLESMSGVRFVIPQHSEYGTAIGAALCYIERRQLHEVR